MDYQQVQVCLTFLLLYICLSGNCTCDVYINNNKLNPVIPYQRFQYNHQIVADNSQVHIPFKFNVTVEEYLRDPKGRFFRLELQGSWHKTLDDTESLNCQENINTSYCVVNYNYTSSAILDSNYTQVSFNLTNSRQALCIVNLLVAKEPVPVNFESVFEAMDEGFHQLQVQVRAGFPQPHTYIANCGSKSYNNSYGTFLIRDSVLRNVSQCTVAVQNGHGSAPGMTIITPKIQPLTTEAPQPCSKWSSDSTAATVTLGILVVILLFGLLVLVFISYRRLSNPNPSGVEMNFYSNLANQQEGDSLPDCRPDRPMSMPTNDITLNSVANGHVSLDTDGTRYNVQPQDSPNLPRTSSHNQIANGISDEEKPGVLLGPQLQGPV